MLAIVQGRKARFCGVACRDGFRYDRECGMIYSATKFPRYGFVSPESTSVLQGTCCYCSADVRFSRIPASHAVLAQHVADAGDGNFLCVSLPARAEPRR